MELSWQTRSLAMVMASSGGNASEEVARFAASLTIDNEEYEQFNSDRPQPQQKKLPVHASTQEQAAENNFNSAADRNSFEMLSMFGMGMEKGKPGQ